MKRNRLLSMLLATVLVLTLLAGCGSEPAPAATPEPAAPASEAPAAKPAAPAEEPAAEKFVVLNSTKGMDNQYYVELDRGGKEAAAQLGMEYVTLSAENNEQKQVADLGVRTGHLPARPRHHHADEPVDRAGALRSV